VKRQEKQLLAVRVSGMLVLLAGLAVLGTGLYRFVTHGYVQGDTGVLLLWGPMLMLLSRHAGRVERAMKRRMATTRDEVLA
jgi:hypothetical protein